MRLRTLPTTLYMLRLVSSGWISPALIVSLAISCNPSAAQHMNHSSPYAGEEHQVIKSLSAKDIEQLKAGAGWGLAKAAELNGVPGPKHVLELKNELGLSTEQEVAIQTLFLKMQKEAIAIGEKLIQLEQKLESRFRRGSLSDLELKGILNEIGEIRAELRFVHLAAHLQTPLILSAEQVASYSQLRGYSAVSTCAQVPSGHDPEMWRLHNGCSEN